MRTKITAAILVLALWNAHAQDSGNANYGNNHYTVNQANTILMTGSNANEMTISIKGIYNERATSKIAVFSIMQLGKTAEEATNLMDEKISAVRADIQSSGKEIELVSDMISFVPTYEYDINKKIFNPKTYNEKPSGFELKKNLIIKFKTDTEFNKIIAACAKQEIYDLAKVDYVTTNMDLIRSQLQTRALEEYKKFLGNYSLIMNTDLAKKEKVIQEGYNVVYPMESYRSYQAFSQADASFGRKDVVVNVKKNTTQYYNAVPMKSHSFIINPDLAEPTIQVFYDLTINIKLKEDQLPKNTIQKNNKFYIITAAGDIKALNI